MRNLSGIVLWSTSHNVSNLCGDCTVNVFSIPTLPTTTTYFIRLELLTPQGISITINDYWLSTKPDVLDWPRSNFFTTFCKSYGDLTGLRQLPPVSLQLTSTQTGAFTYDVSIKNPTEQVAFFIRLVAENAQGQTVLPVLWDDNYITLFAGESRSISVTFPTHLSTSIHFRYEVFNDEK